MPRPTEFLAEAKKESDLREAGRAGTFPGGAALPLRGAGAQPLAKPMGKREEINRAAADRHLEPRDKSAKRNSGPGYERGADMEGAFKSNPGRMSIKAIGPAPRTGRSAEKDPGEN